MINVWWIPRSSETYGRISVAPVSYTHLDVYKRQIQAGTGDINLLFYPVLFTRFYGKFIIESTISPRYELKKHCPPQNKKEAAAPQMKY